MKKKVFRIILAVLAVLVIVVILYVSSHRRESATARQQEIQSNNNNNFVKGNWFGTGNTKQANDWHNFKTSNPFGKKDSKNKREWDRFKEARWIDKAPTPKDGKKCSEYYDEYSCTFKGNSCLWSSGGKGITSSVGPLKCIDSGWG
jgi:hypothetical protein